MNATRLSYSLRSMTPMTKPELLEHLAGLQHLKGFPTNEDSAVQAPHRFYRVPHTRSLGAREVS